MRPFVSLHWMMCLAEALNIWFMSCCTFSQQCSLSAQLQKKMTEEHICLAGDWLVNFPLIVCFLAVCIAWCRHSNHAGRWQSTQHRGTHSSYYSILLASIITATCSFISWRCSGGWGSLTYWHVCVFQTVWLLFWNKTQGLLPSLWNTESTSPTLEVFLGRIPLLLIS